MKFDKSRLRSAAVATALAGAMIGAATLPAAARGYVSFGFGAPAYVGPTYYSYGYYPPPPVYDYGYYGYYPAPVYPGPAVNFGFDVR
jgi:hypothetical protein